jgi:hypothetical protein
MTCVRWRLVFHERTNCKVELNNRTGIEVLEGEWWNAYTLHVISEVDGASAVTAMPWC